MAAILQWAPRAACILEVGCGEGAMTERLIEAYPVARITAIDVTPRLGRLFRGDQSRVEFIQAPVGDIAAREPGAFDLVLLSDVVHHVPLPLREPLLADIRTTLAPGGQFIFKEWVSDRSLIHWACDASDRYLTGDDVHYLSDAQAKALVSGQFGAESIRDERRIAPWSNNMALRVMAA